MKNIGRLAAMAVLAVVLTATAAEAMTFDVSKQLAGLKFTEQTRLPKAPASAKSKADCGDVLVEAKTDAGKLVAASGWGVTGEGPLGDYTAVSFAGSFKWGPGAVCTITSGHVGIFRGKALVALLSPEQASDDTIGSILAIDGGSVRVLTGEETPYPQGDLRAVYDGFTLGAVAEADQVCGDTGTVPNVYGMSIDKARLAVLGDGWKPLPSDASQVPAPGEREHNLSKAGVTEVQFCAGTGLANCEFDYATPAGKLSLETIGEEDFPQVIGYAVKCKK